MISSTHSLLFLLGAHTMMMPGVNAFVSSTNNRRLNTRLAFLATSSSSPPMPSPLMMGDDGDAAVECFIIEPDEDDEGNIVDYDYQDSPKVVCTSEPEEYAWMNGIDESRLKPTDEDGDVYEEKMECVEGASPRGIPEWECI